MLAPLSERQFTKILIICQQNAVLLDSARENVIVLRLRHVLCDG